MTVKLKNVPKGQRMRSLALLGVAAGLAGLLTGTAHASEARSYVVSWFHLATYSQDGDCENGPDMTAPEIAERELNRVVGPENAQRLLKSFGSSQGALGQEFYSTLANRGRIDGQPVSVYLNPTSVPDPGLKTVIGRHAYGFNLDGKGQDDANAFQDPESGERGVDNQLFRAVGCIENFRAMPPARPSWEAFVWDVVRDQMPAWVITMRTTEGNWTDGKVEITLQRSLDHVRRDAASQVLPDSTYRLSATQRAPNILRGHIKNGLITTDAPGEVEIGADPTAGAEVRMKQVQLRFKVEKDGSLKGIMGGYREWAPVYFVLAQGGSITEFDVGIDAPALYYALRRMADSNPDPVTGQNTAISSAYVMEAVPAFIADPAGKPIVNAGLAP